MLTSLHYQEQLKFRDFQCHQNMKILLSILIIYMCSKLKKKNLGGIATV